MLTSHAALQAADQETQAAQAQAAAEAASQEQLQDAERQLAEARAQQADLERRLIETAESSKSAQGKLRDQQEAERAKVKRAVADLKKGQERWGLCWCCM